MSRKVVVMSDDLSDGQMTEEALRRNFPIPRYNQIDNPCNPYIPNIEIHFPHIDQEKFLILSHISQADVLEQEENGGQEHSELYQELIHSFTHGNDDTIQEHIIRKYLLHAQSKLFELTNTKSLTQIGILHGDLLDLSEKLYNNSKFANLSDFCDMLLGEVFDLFSSTVSQIAKRQYWAQSLPADALIQKVLQRELMNLRTTPVNNLMKLSSCLVRRSMENAPEESRNRLIEWAAKEHISLKV